MCVTVGRSDMSKFTAGSLQGAFTVNNERTVLKYFVGIPSRPKCVCKFADWFSSVFQSLSAGAYQMEPPSPIQALGVNPFPSRFIIRPVPRGDFERQRWEEPIT